jgi:Leucine-rich repeat (LRR) protein
MHRVQASNNNISRIPDVLAGCSKLSKLDLEVRTNRMLKLLLCCSSCLLKLKCTTYQGNKLVTLSENMFVSWTMLTELNLGMKSNIRSVEFM